MLWSILDWISSMILDLNELSIGKVARFLNMCCIQVKGSDSSEESLERNSLNSITAGWFTLFTFRNEEKESKISKICSFESIYCL